MSLLSGLALVSSHRRGGHHAAFVPGTGRISHTNFRATTARTMHSGPNGGTTRGNLVTNDGRAFGYQLTFFRRGIPQDQVETLPSKWSITQLYLAHFAVSDLKKGRFHVVEKLSRAGVGKAGAEAERLHVWIDRWRAKLGPEHGRDARRRSCRRPTATSRSTLTVVPDKPCRSWHRRHQPKRRREWTSLSLLLVHQSGDAGENHAWPTNRSTWREPVGWITSSDPPTWAGDSSDGIGSVSRWPIRRTLCSIACGGPTAHPILPRAARSSTRTGGRSISVTREFTLEPTSHLEQSAQQGSLSRELAADRAFERPFTRTGSTHDEQDFGTRTQHTGHVLGRRHREHGHLSGKPITGLGYMELTGYAERFSKKL